MKTKKILSLALSLAMVASAEYTVMNNLMESNSSTVFAANDKNYSDKAVKTTSNGIVYYVTKANDIRVCDYVGTRKDVTIPAEIDGMRVRAIDRGTFSGNNTIESVYIEDGGVSVIESTAFLNCKNLEYVHISEKVNMLFQTTFTGCQKLKKVDFPSTLRTIGTECFFNCPYLTVAIVPSTVTQINLRAFGYRGIFTIDDNGNVNIDESSVSKDDNVYIVGEPGSEAEDYANSSGLKFWDINNKPYPDEIDPEFTLVTTTVEETTTLEETTTVDETTTPEETTVFTPEIHTSNSDKYGNIYEYYEDPENPGGIIITKINWDGNKLDCCLVIPEYIGEYMVTGINDNVVNTDEFDTIMLPDTLKSIGGGNFNKSKNHVYIPKSVNKIDNSSFETGTAYAYVYCDSDAYYFMEEEGRISNSDRVIGIKSEGEYDYCDMSDVKDKMTTIGSGIIRYNGSDPNSKIPETLGGNPVLAITRFGYLNNDAVESVDLPQCTYRIEPHAFDNCTNLTEIKLPKFMKEIADYAFARCDKLSSIELPENDGYDETCDLGKYIFEGCSSLKALKIPAMTGMYGSDIFTGWTGVEYVDLSEHTVANWECGLNRNKNGSLINEDTSVITIFGIPGTDVEEYAKYEKFTFEPCFDPNSYIKGDSNLDGVVDVRDVTVLNRHIVKAEAMTSSIAFKNSDILEDAVIDVKDLGYLKKYLIKTISSLDNITNHAAA